MGPPGVLTFKQGDVTSYSNQDGTLVKENTQPDELPPCDWCGSVPGRQASPSCVYMTSDFTAKSVHKSDTFNLKELCESDSLFSVWY